MLCAHQKVSLLTAKSEGKPEPAGASSAHTYTTGKKKNFRQNKGLTCLQKDTAARQKQPAKTNPLRLADKPTDFLAINSCDSMTQQRGISHTSSGLHGERKTSLSCSHYGKYCPKATDQDVAMNSAALRTPCRAGAVEEGTLSTPPA